MGRLLVYAAAVCVLLASGSAVAEGVDEPGRSKDVEPARSADRRREVPAVDLRAGIGVGVNVGSDQEDLVQAEGYRGTRYHVTLEVRKTLDEHFGLGFFGLYGWRNADADPQPSSDSYSPLATAPTYSERLFIAAGSVPISFCLCEHTVARFAIVPFVGAGFGHVELYRQMPWHTAPAFGGSLELFVPSLYTGISAGAYFVPFEAPGQAGAHDDLGAYFFSLLFGADVG